MLGVISPSPNEVLQALLQEHGYCARISQDRVVIIGHEAQMSGDVYSRSETDPAHIQLDVRVHLPDGRALVESCSGIGPTLKYAMGDGFNSFCQSSFHVLLKAFFNNSCDLPSKEWRFPTGSFAATIGNITLRGKPPVEGEELVNWFETFADLIQQAPLTTHQTHWIRLYYAHYKEEQVSCEVLLDNETWEEMQEAVSNFPWPQSEEFYSERIFLVLQPYS